MQGTGAAFGHEVLWPAAQPRPACAPDLEKRTRNELPSKLVYSIAGAELEEAAEAAGAAGVRAAVVAAPACAAPCAVTPVRLAILCSGGEHQWCQRLAQEGRGGAEAPRLHWHTNLCSCARRQVGWQEALSSLLAGAWVQAGAATLDRQGIVPGAIRVAANDGDRPALAEGWPGCAMRPVSECKPRGGRTSQGVLPPC